MKNRFDIAVGFAEKVKKLESIIQIILFGSVARGEDTAKSDIDIAIIHDAKHPDKLKKKINKLLHPDIQISFFKISDLKDESELVSALTGEGILLYGKPIEVKLKNNELQPKILIIYDTKELDKSQRMKLNRALHGSTSVSKYKGREYKTETKGILEERGITKLARSVVLADPKKASRITKTLKLFKAKWKEILIWT